MRILHVLSSTDFAGGGPIEGVIQRAKVLSRLGHCVEIASCDPPDAAWLDQTGVPIHALGPGRGGFAYAPRLRPWLLQNVPRFDAVVVNGIWQYHGLCVRKVMRSLRRPYVVFTHGMLDPWFKRTYPLKHLKKAAYWPFGDYRLLRDAAAVLFTCEEEKLLARQSFRRYRAKERVVSYGTAAPAGSEHELIQGFLERWPNLKGTRIILFVGRIHPKKGCDLAIEAFAQVCEQDPNLRLVFAGPDQVGIRQALETRGKTLGIADRIIWTGMLTGDLKWGAFHAAEAFLLPSHQENFGIVVAEAMACGTPVMITDKVNIWREVDGDGAGLVSSDTVDGVRTMLEEWIHLEAGRKGQMSHNARQSFQNRFEIERSAQSLLEVLNEVQRSTP